MMVQFPPFNLINIIFLLQIYIVFMGSRPEGIDPTSLASRHAAMAQKILGRLYIVPIVQ